MPLDPGYRLGPYEILALIGAGGMGEVYRAKDTRLGRTVAVKILRSHPHSDRARLRLQREARAVSSLNHAHICALYDVGSENGVDFLVMEYLEGETLAQRLSRGPLPFKELFTYAIQIGKALDAAHRHGRIHRDLKPGNVMLTSSGAKVLDFGLASIDVDSKVKSDASQSTLTTDLAPLTQKGSWLGTLQYMSPEQVEGKKADARSDIFAFGAVLYEMATGCRAFEGRSPLAVAAATLAAEPAEFSRVPPGLRHVIKRCLEKDPEDRWQTARDLTNALEWISQHDSGFVKPDGQMHNATMAPPQGRGKWGSGFRLPGARYLAVAVITLSLIVATGSLWTSWNGVEYLAIYIVGQQDDPEISQIMRAISDAGVEASLQLGGVPIRLVEVDDQGNPDVAQQVASRVAAEEDTLLVIGHFTSTQTMAALPSYLDANPPVPVLLTTETNPDLVPAVRLEDAYHPVFRLSPTDDLQAVAAVDLVVANEAESCWVVEDTTNTVYSSFLAQAFMENAGRKNRKVVGRSIVGNPPSAESFRLHQVDCVFYAGSWSNALMLVHQVRAIVGSIGMPLPLIILSDGAADPRLLEQGRDALDGVYLTHTMTAENYVTQRYRGYGQDAFHIASELILEIDRRSNGSFRDSGPSSLRLGRLFGGTNGADARELMQEVMRRAVEAEYVFMTPEQSYRFLQDGSPAGLGFHIWQIRDGEFQDIP